jgi:hypothetical protein
LNHTFNFPKAAGAKSPEDFGSCATQRTQTTYTVEVECLKAVGVGQTSETVDDFILGTFFFYLVKEGIRCTVMQLMNRLIVFIFIFTGSLIMHHGKSGVNSMNFGCWEVRRLS